MRTMFRRATALATLLVGLVVLVGCGDDDDGPMEPSSDGTIRVTVATTGAAVSTEYSIRVDAEDEQVVEPDGTLVITSISPGDHDVLLLAVPTSCTVSGGTTRTVTVTANEVAQVVFDVTCAEPGEPKPPEEPTGGE